MKKIDKALVLNIISAFARFYMAYIWISAGSAKINQHLAVAQTIQAYEIFTPEWSNYLAYVIGPLEIAGGVLLLLGLFLRPASWVSIAVLTLFITGIALHNEHTTHTTQPPHKKAGNHMMHGELHKTQKE